MKLENQKKKKRKTTKAKYYIGFKMIRPIRDIDVFV